MNVKNHMGDKVEPYFKLPLVKTTLIFGVLSVLFGIITLREYYGYPVLISIVIPTFICGCLALMRIKKEPARFKGIRFIVIGLILGLCGFVLFLFNIHFYK